MSRRAIAIFALATSLTGCNCEGTQVATLAPRIEVTPPILDLGELPAGSATRGSIAVANVGDALLSIASTTLSGDPAFVLTGGGPMQLPPNGEVTLEISVRASTVAELSAELAIASDDRLEPIVRVPIRLRAVAPPPCDDGNSCTEDFFDPEARSCGHRFADGLPCASADRCIVGAVCSQGLCLGKSRSCDDHSACTRDLCRQSDGECLFIQDPGACDDHNPCTIDSCGADGCVHEPVLSGTACDDGDACTTGDACFAGQCVGQGATEGASCDDGDSCTVNDTCHGGHCSGLSLVQATSEGSEVFSFPLMHWDGAFLHRREVSLSDEGTFFGLDHLPLQEPMGLTHVVFTVRQCGSTLYDFSYRPPDSYVLVRFVRREMQLSEDGTLRIVVGVRQLPDDGYAPLTTSYLLDPLGAVKASVIQGPGGETGRALLPDGSHIFGMVWPLTHGPPTAEMPTQTNLVVIREDRMGNNLWRHERESDDWAEFLGVAGPRVMFFAGSRFGALDFNTGQTVWSTPTPLVAKEMALSTHLNLGVARVGSASGNLQLVGVEVIEGRQIFTYPAVEDPMYLPRTDPVIAADGRVLVMMERRADTGESLGLEWVELSATGTELSRTPLPFFFPEGFDATRHEDDSYPTVADDGVSYIGYADHFWAVDPGGAIRWTLTSTIPNAFTGTVPLLRDDGVLLISEGHRTIKGIRTNGGKMSPEGWASFRHDRRRTNFTP